MSELDKCIDWIRSYFDETHGENAVVGISGGKDSTVVAALCAKALGKDRVIGVLMPNGIQSDIDDSHKVCDFLGIRKYVVDISGAYSAIANGVFNSSDEISEVSEQARINIAPRLRMTTLYAVAQCVNGRVANTSNFDESLMGYSTLWGDSVGDFAPLVNLHVSGVIDMGHRLGLPEWMVKKAPSDGLTGKTDEDSLGFSYKVVESMFDKLTDHRRSEFTEKEKKACERWEKMRWKRSMVCGMPSFDPQEDAP